jgi:single-strand DNA-binding protein
VNIVALIGRLTRDPETKFTQAGKPVSKFSIAVDTGFGDRKATSFFDVTAWQKTAEFVDKYFKKGAKIAITGRLNQETWTDQKSGDKRSKVVIVAERVDFADSKTERQPGEEDFPTEEAPKEEEF